jgi:hypothetical protein
MGGGLPSSPSLSHPVRCGTPSPPAPGPVKPRSLPPTQARLW